MDLASSVTRLTGAVSVLDEQRFATTKSCSEHQRSTGFKNGSWWPGWLR